MSEQHWVLGSRSIGLFLAIGYSQTSLTLLVPYMGDTLLLDVLIYLLCVVLPGLGVLYMKTNFFRTDVSTPP